MFQSLFECTNFNLGCHALYNKSWASTYLPISEAGMYLSFEKDMRGGVSYISKKYSHIEANNKYFKSSDQKQESKHIVYLDANNLYHNTMSKIFPTGEFKRIDPKSFDNINMYS